jgi:hypothetical protein
LISPDSLLSIASFGLFSSGVDAAFFFSCANICCSGGGIFGGDNGGNGGDGVGGDGSKLGGVNCGNDETGVSFVVDGVFGGGEGNFIIPASEATSACFVDFFVKYHYVE